MRKLINISPETEKKLRKKGLEKGYTSLAPFAETILESYANDRKVSAKQMKMKF